MCVCVLVQKDSTTAGRSSEKGWKWAVLNRLKKRKKRRILRSSCRRVGFHFPYSRFSRLSGA